MKKMKFSCRLLSDVIISQSSNSEGEQKSLDFIPGGNFLGIVASQIYKNEDSSTLDIFHSGKVRFGDANPSIEGIRGLKVPAAMFYPKLQSPTELCYIHHLISDASKLQSLQLKQCRNGFYAFSGNIGREIDVNKNFSIKSSYDRENRRSKDKGLFGYESMADGTTFYFEVESDLDEAANMTIEKALVGRRYLGRSRTAQYGLAEIQKVDDYKEVESSSKGLALEGVEYTVVYADARLIFLDDNGNYNPLPKAKDFGFKEGEIMWEKCQVRTFQYAPWNGKRHSYDNDRFGLEKGSVFVIKGKRDSYESCYVGAYNNEGFGKVIFNPDFLLGDIAENGKANYILEKSRPANDKTHGHLNKKSSVLIKYLSKEKERRNNESNIYDIVNDFIEKNKNILVKKGFASQWGSIRSLAMVNSDSQKLIDVVDSYLSHGVAEKDWDDFNRKGVLMDFMEKHKSNDLQRIVINLSSEMAKRSRKGK